MNLTAMRSRVREDLQDENAAAYRWTDDQVDAAVGRVVGEYSLAHPLQEEDEITSTEGSRQLDISGLSGLLRVHSVEYPVDFDPPSYQRIARWGGALYMADKGDGVKKARVRWLKGHTLDAEGSTIPAEHEEIVVLGATAYLARSASVNTVDRASIAGRYATAGFAAWAEGRMALYRRRLRAVSTERRVFSGELQLGE